MHAEYPLFLIPLLPLLGAAFALLIGRRFGKNVVSLVTCGAVAAAAFIAIRAVWLLGTQLPPGGQLVDTFYSASWMHAGDLNLSAGLMLDRLSSVLVLVVTCIGFLIHLYSTAYMEHDDRYTRFFGYLNLFMGAMLILVLGDSLPVTFVGWEGVGLCSYLLIGFWFDKDAFAYAGRKAFVVNRVGDFAFLLAMFLLFSVTGTLQYGGLQSHLSQLATPMWFGMPAAYFVGLLVLVGATGKSAQIPLYVWLPDAMAGPTPVSALIHAATMVTAGVYMCARLHFVFEVAPATLAAVGSIGALTALFAAVIALAQKDLKKVLAYSTISQLGFMFIAVGSYLDGTSNYQAGVFHLVTHAFFKAGLFLGAGSVLHALSNQGDITRMGGLKKWMPHTRWTFLIYCLAISGIFPFAGFWSKDAILGGAAISMWPAAPDAGALQLFCAHHLGMVIYIVGLVAAGCTAFYMFRLYFLVFEGEFRGTDEDRHHLHESPPAMTGVLWVLALGAIGIGFIGVPDVIHGSNHFATWLDPVLPAQARAESLGGYLGGALLATVVSLCGIALAWVLYGQGISERIRKLVAALPRAYRVVSNKFYVDELYDLLIVRPVRFTAFVLWKFVDSFLIDLVLVNGIGLVVTTTGKLIKYVQSGDMQRYIVAVLVGASGILLVATRYDAYAAAHFESKVDGSLVMVRAEGDGPTASRIEYRVNWHDGEPSELQSSPLFTHRYEKKGKQKVTVEAIDPRWQTRWSVTQTVSVK